MYPGFWLAFSSYFGGVLGVLLAIAVGVFIISKVFEFINR